MTLWIQNVGEREIIHGRHMDAGERGVLIQITEPNEIFPIPKNTFDKVFQFKFLDVDTPQIEGAPTYEQARDIVGILRMAREEYRNVIVHCHAGLCRSGAVAEIGIGVLDFADTGSVRIPNVLLKNLMLKVLHLSYYDED